MKKILALTLIFTLFIGVIAIAEEENGEESYLNSTVNNIAETVNAQVNVISGNSNLEVNTGKKSVINTNTGVKSKVYINGEDLNNLRPQYHISKTTYTYNDKWIKNEIDRINHNIEVIAKSLDNLYAKEHKDANDLYTALLLLRQELYGQMVRLHYGQAILKTQINSNIYEINEDFYKFDAQTTFRVDQLHTLMSIRLLEHLGVKFYYERDGEIGIVTMTFNDKTIVLRQDSDIMVVVDTMSAEKVKLKLPMRVVNNRAYIPTRDVSEYLGFVVLWDEYLDEIIIKLPNEEKPDLNIDEAIYATEEEKKEEQRPAENKKEEKEAEKDTSTN